MRETTLFDRAHLDAQTFGDEALARELLSLFEEQCRRLLPGIADRTLRLSDRADLTHSLKGSALGVGATAIAAHASELEHAMRAGEFDEAGLEALKRAIEETLSLLAHHDRGSLTGTPRAS